MLLVEYRLLDKLKVINEGTGPSKKLKVRGKFQKCDEQNNNGRVYPRKILESQVAAIQEKIKDRALVGALDHPPNDAIHLSQASHLITNLWVEANGDVMGEAEILSTPSGKIVEALLNDNVKIGISSRGLGTVLENKNVKVVNEDFKLITFDLVSDPSTKGAFPSITESVKINSQKAKEVIDRCKRERIFLTALESAIDSKLSEGLVKKANKAKKREWEYGKGRERLSKNKTDIYSESPNVKKRFFDAQIKSGEHRKSNKIGNKGGWATAGTRAVARSQESKKYSSNPTIKKLVEMLVSKLLKVKVVESIQRIEEGAATSKDKAAIKKYLLNHLQDLKWSRPLEPLNTGEKYDDNKEVSKDLDFLKRILNLIDEL